MRKLPALALVFLLFSSVASATTLRVVSRGEGKSRTVDVVMEGVTLNDAVASLAPYVAKRIVVQSGGSAVVTFRKAKITATAALKEIAASSHLIYLETESEILLRGAGEPTVTIDVKDGEVHEILSSIAKQCGIRNLIVDPDVHGTGTFLFRDLPCETALNTVLRTLGLRGDWQPHSLVRVESGSK